MSQLPRRAFALWMAMSLVNVNVGADSTESVPVFIQSLSGSDGVDVKSLCDKLNTSEIFACADRWDSGASGHIAQTDVQKLQAALESESERWLVARDSDLLGRVYDVVFDDTPRSFDGYFSFEDSIALFEQPASPQRASRAIASTLRTPKRSDRASSTVTISGSKLSRKALESARASGEGVTSSVPLEDLRIADNFVQGNSTSRTLVVQHATPELGVLSAFAGGCLRPCRTANNFYFASAGSNVTVYVVDTPIADHVQFKQVQTGESRLVVEEFVSPSAKDVAGPCSRDLGTHLGAAVGGFEFGSAKDVDLVSVGVVPGCGGTAKASDLLAGLDWMRAHYLDNVHPDSAVALISPYISSQDPASEAIAKSVQLLDNMGIAFAAAAGDLHQNACGYVPPNMPNVLTVGGVSVDQDTLSAKPWAWSNFGKCVDVFAPSMNIRSASPACFECTSTQSRTATAASRVAGLMAQYVQSQTNASSAIINDAVLQASTQQMIREQQFPFRQTTRNVAQSLLSLSVFEVRDVTNR